MVFNLKCISLSQQDIKQNITIPQELTPELAELVGVIIGDGHIYKNKSAYVIGFTGNPKLEEEYYEYLKRLIKIVWNKEVKIKKEKSSIRIILRSKGIFEFLTKELGLVYGGKCSQYKFIPHIIVKDWNLVKYAIRGLADTDGSIFVADKPGSLAYPSIEITTTSHTLAFSLREILLNKKFRVANIWKYCSKRSKLITYKIPLNGFKNLLKWNNEIGFSNLYKAQKAKTVLERKWARGDLNP